MEEFEIITIENDVPMLSAKMETILVGLDEAEKHIKEQKEVYREALLRAMEKHNIKSIGTNNVTITYKDEYDRESLDSKRLREEQPDIYDEFVKFTTVKSSIAIKVKE